MSSDCGINSALGESSGCDRAFMGTTHALSAVAVFFWAIAFFPGKMYELLGSSDLAVVILSALVITGGCLSVDLDNSASTAKSSLGALGGALSAIYRSVSVVIQTTIRTRRDDPDPNPHRGFFHTVPAALIIGLLILAGTKLNLGQFTLPGLGAFSSGRLFALVVTAISVHMALAGLFRGVIRKVKKSAGPFGELAAAGITLGVVYALFDALPHNVDFWWLGASFAGGMIIHSLGDCFTTAGSPITFPLKRKGKLWYTTRFLPIKAGGVVEQYIFMPVFGIICFVSFLRIAGLI